MWIVMNCNITRFGSVHKLHEQDFGYLWPPPPSCEHKFTLITWTIFRNFQPLPSPYIVLRNILSIIFYNTVQKYYPSNQLFFSTQTLLHKKVVTCNKIVQKDLWGIKTILKETLNRFVDYLISFKTYIFTTKALIILHIIK